jgi:hypothetical protein
MAAAVLERADAMGHVLRDWDLAEKRVLVQRLSGDGMTTSPRRRV